MTFSIVACDTKEGTCGVAVASKFVAVGMIVPWAKADVGAVATQGNADVSFGQRGIDLMQSGQSPKSALNKLTSDKNQVQVGMVNAKGKSASYTGKDCQGWAGGITGDGYAIQGNILVGDNVIDKMEKAYLNTNGNLQDRLYAALSAGDKAGGDKRGRQSAAILVVKKGGGLNGVGDRMIDYRVDDDSDPVGKLGRILKLPNWNSISYSPKIYVGRATMVGVKSTSRNISAAVKKYGK